MSQILEAPVPGGVAAPGSTNRFADPTDLVVAAIDGDRYAWDSLVSRYTPLVVQITAYCSISIRSASPERCPDGLPPRPGTNHFAS